MEEGRASDDSFYLPQRHLLKEKSRLLALTAHFTAFISRMIELKLFLETAAGGGDDEEEEEEGEALQVEEVVHGRGSSTADPLTIQQEIAVVEMEKANATALVEQLTASLREKEEMLSQQREEVQRLVEEHDAEVEKVNVEWIRRSREEIQKESDYIRSECDAVFKELTARHEESLLALAAEREGTRSAYEKELQMLKQELAKAVGLGLEHVGDKNKMLVEDKDKVLEGEKDKVEVKGEKEGEKDQVVEKEVNGEKDNVGENENDQRAMIDQLREALVTEERKREELRQEYERWRSEQALQETQWKALHEEKLRSLVDQSGLVEEEMRARASQASARVRALRAEVEVLKETLAKSEKVGDTIRSEWEGAVRETRDLQEQLVKLQAAMTMKDQCVVLPLVANSEVAPARPLPSLDKEWERGGGGGVIAGDRDGNEATPIDSATHSFADAKKDNEDEV